MSERPANSPRRPQTTLRVDDYTLPGQEELRAISNALDAALGYSPLRQAPRESADAFALVTRLVEDRFWDKVYVDRPEMSRIISELDKGQIVVITGERGTGKSTAIQAAVRRQQSQATASAPKAHVLPFVFDANRYEADLACEADAAQTLYRTIYQGLHELAIAGGLVTHATWLAYLYEHDAAFDSFRLRLHRDGLVPLDQADWHTLVAMDEYAAVTDKGIDGFTQDSPSNQLRQFLEFLHQRTTYAVLIVIDNIDQLPNAVQRKAAAVLSTMMASTSGRVRGAIAVRPENYKPIQRGLDTAPRPPHIPISVQPTWSREDLARPTEELTVRFIERRLALVRDAQVMRLVLDTIPRQSAESLARSSNLPGHETVDAYFDILLQLLSAMVFDVFRSNDPDDAVRPRQNNSFIEFIHMWHNGSLRECARSLVAFVEDVLQNKTNMFNLRDLMLTVIQADDADQGRFAVRRMTRSLLYRHLLLWESEEEGRTAPENVMVFDAVEEDCNPPIYFLRLRILQYLAHRDSQRVFHTYVSDVRRDIGKLGVPSERIDEILRRLAVRRYRDDSGLLRIDEHEEGDPGLSPTSEIQLLPAGRFLVTQLCLTTEYLFWSAVSDRVSTRQRHTPRVIDDDEIQRDSFRAEVAAKFLATDVVGKFKEEHPYWDGPVNGWPRAAGRRRLMLYSQLFGFGRNDWLLDRCCKAMLGFINQGKGGEYNSAKASIQQVRNFTNRLNTAARPDVSETSVR